MSFTRYFFLSQVIGVSEPQMVHDEADESEYVTALTKQISTISFLSYLLSFHSVVSTYSFLMYDLCLLLQFLSSCM